MKAKDISDLYLFCQSVVSGGFSAASVQMEASAPTLSRAVTNLEKRLGEKLIHRNAKLFQLTAAGEEYYQSIAPLFLQLQDEWQNLANNQQELTGEIRVSCPEPFADNFLQDLSIEFMQLHPKVMVTIIFAADTEKFFDERIDLALVTSPSKVNHLVQRKLFEAEMVLAAAPSYIEKYGAPLKAQELSAHSLLSGNHLPIWPLEENGNIVSISYSPKYKVSSLRLNVNATIAGVGICLMPKAIFTPLSLKGKLEQVLPHVNCPKGEAYLVWADRKLIASRVSRFRDMIFEKFQFSEAFLSAVGKKDS